MKSIESITDLTHLKTNRFRIRIPPLFRAWIIVIKS